MVVSNKRRAVAMLVLPQDYVGDWEATGRQRLRNDRSIYPVTLKSLQSSQWSNVLISDSGLETPLEEWASLYHLRFSAALTSS